MMHEATGQSGWDNAQNAALKVRCLRLSVYRELTLLVPNTMVAEVVDVCPIDVVRQLPDWVGGILSWRGRHVPLVLLERLLGRGSAIPAERRRYVIFNTLRQDSRLPFIAIAITEMPQLLMAEQDKLEYDYEKTAQEPAILAYLQYQGEPVMVPNLDEIERMLSHLGITA